MKTHTFTKLILSLLAFFAAAFAPATSSAQTTLSAGDVAVIGYNTSGTPDTFALLFLKDLAAGTTFYVNDNEVAADGGTNFTDTNEVEATFTVSSGQTVAAGSVVILPWGNTLVTDPRFTWTGHTSGGLGNNDELYIYTGTSPTAAPTAFIFYAKIGTSVSARPNGLTAGSTFISPTGAASRYKTVGATYSGTASALLSAIGNTAANWEAVIPGAAGDWTFTVTSATITGAATATAFTTTYGTASTAQSFSVSGSNLTANITATAPTGFEVSSDGTTYGATATITQSGGSASGTISIRLKATAVVGGSYNAQNIALTSTGATTVNIATAASGNTVNAAALTITGMSGVSRDYNGTTTATLSGTPAYVGLQNGESFSVTGTASANFDTAAVGTAKPITVTGYTAPSGNYTVSQPTGLTADVNAVALMITATDVTKPFGNTLTGGVGYVGFTSMGLVNSETIGSVTVAYGSGAAALDPVGNYPGSVTLSAATGGTFTPTNYSISYVPGDINVSASPTIATSGTLTAVNTIYGTASPSPTSFTVSGGNLMGDITVTPPAGFEVSTTIGSGYTTSLALTPTSQTVAATTVYVRLRATATVSGSPYSGNVMCLSSGATSQNVATAASAVAAKGLTITGVSGVSREYDATDVATLSGTPAYVGLENGESFSVTGTASATFNNKTVGTAKPITVIGYTAPSANYTVSQPTGLTADVNAKALTVSGAAVTTKQYDGNMNATIIGMLVGVINPDVVTLNGTGTFASAGPGTGIAVTSTSTLGGADGGNYSLTQPSGLTGDITANTNNNLSALTLSTGALNPGFASGTLNYTAHVLLSTSSITVTPTTASAAATVTVNGNPVTSGTASSAIALNAGSGNLITVVVTAQDTTTKTYTIDVTRSDTFSSGNLVVLRVSAGAPLSNIATAVSLAEYSTVAAQSAPLQTVAIDSTATGLTLTGNSTTQGTLTRSVDGSLLTFGGYRKAAGGTNPQSDQTATTKRVIGVIGASVASTNLATAVTDGYSQDSFRGVATVSGTSYYLSGAGSSATGGVRYVSTIGGDTTSVPLNPGSGNSNTRQVAILGGNLFVSSGAGNPGFGVHKVGSGLPTSGNQTYTSSITTTAQIQSYYFTNLGSANNWASTGFDTVYTSDGTTLAKWSYNGTAWVSNGSVAIAGLGNIIGETVGTTVTIYGTTTTEATGTVFRLTDSSGSNATITGSTTTLATAGTNTAFRGIAFAPSYTLVYNGNGNTGGTAPTDSSSPYAPGSTVTVLGNTGSLVKTGYTFAGWNTAADGTGTAYSPSATFTINANTALYAQWTINTYTLTYAAGANGSISGTSPQTVNHGASGTAVTAVPDVGYSFVQWSDSSTANPRTDTNVTGNITVTATFAINTYTVAYDGNGNTGGAAPTDPSSPYNHGSTVTVLGAGTLVKTGYTFTGWNTAANGSGTAYSPSATFTVTANTTLFAQWMINSYTVSYDGNGNDGGTAPVDANSPYTFGSTVTVLGPGTLTKSGYTFTGWNTMANGSGTGYVQGSTFSIAGNTTLFAQWSSIPTISGGGTTAAFTTTYGAASAVQNFPVSGVNLTANLVATAPAGFEVSNDGLSYAGIATFPQSGGNASGTLRIRLTATALVSGSYNSVAIVLSSTGASSVNITTPASGNTVNAKALTVTGLNGDNKEYDRTDAATFTGTAALSGVVSGDAGNVTLGGTPTAVFTSVTAGNGKTINVSGYTLGGSAAGNYSLSQPTLTANITQKPLTVSGAAVTTKPYDGNMNATITGSLVGVIAPDAVSLVGTGTFASAGPGTGIAVTSTSTLGGADAGNYSLTQPTGLTGDITKLDQTITFNALPNKSVGDADFNLTATASSGLTVTYMSSNAAVATVTGNTVHIVGAGTTNITASQAGDTIYNAAPDVVRSQTVVPGATTLAAGDIAVIGYNTNGSPDNFTILVLKDLGPGTVFYVNDNEVTTDGGTSFADLAEGEASFTVKAGQVIPAGTVIVLPWGASAISTSTYDYSSTSSFGLGNNNEEIYIYTASSITSLTPTAFIYGVKIGTSTAFRGVGLTAGTTFISPPGTGTNPDARYKRFGALYAGTQAQLLSAIGNIAANWESQATVYPFAAADWSFAVNPDTIVTISDPSVVETHSGTTTLTFVVTRSTNTGAFSFNYATADGTATTADNDYVSGSGPVSFTAGGALTQNIDVTINGDTTVELDETLFVRLTNLVNTSGTAGIADNEATGTILGDDYQAPSITTHPASVTIATGASATLTVVASGFPAPTYQWYLGASGDETNPVSGATSASFTTPALISAASYWAKATNVSGSASSNAATITVSGYVTAYSQASINVLTPNTASWDPAGVTVNGTNFINLGLQGVGRIPASAIDSATGESLGSISDMQITGWKKNADGSYSGRINALPDRGYNNGSIFSNYAARINAFDFTFTPYTSSTPTAAQNQIALNFAGSTRFTYNDGSGQKYTTGLLANATTTLFGVPVPAASVSTTQSDGTVANRLTVDAEGLVLDSRPGKSGAGWVSDEYGPYIYHFNSAKQIDGQLQLPQALIPHTPVGTTSFVDTNVNGRRTNQGMEGIAQSPDGTRLFGLMQSATLQDTGTGNQGRFNTRLLVYNISMTDTPNDPIAQYVIQLPRIDSTGSTTNGTTVDRTGAQSAILALNNHQLLILSRDGNGRGSFGSPVFKSILLADLSGATNIDGTYDAEAAAVAPSGTLAVGVTPLTWSEALNMIGKLGAATAEVEKFGLNLNTAPGDINTICEKWEALSLVSANDPANPNDYFLFVGNDNDFVTANIKYMDANGVIQTDAGTIENDTIILAWRVRMTGTFNQAPFVAEAPSAPQPASAGTAFSYMLPSGTIVDPNGDSLTYSALLVDGSSLPAWLTFNSTTRVLSGTPSAVNLGSTIVRITATDGGSLATSTDVTISVSPASGPTLFPQSVASGDPRETSVVLWTRVLDGNTAVNRSVSLHLSTTGTLADVGTTNALGGTNLWTGGALTAQAAHDGVVKVKVTGLNADSAYYYQFTYNGQRSPIGRTRTAPAAGSTRTVKYAAVNCNDFIGRYFNVLKHLADQEADNIDFVLNLGDYIYETTGDASFQTTSPGRVMIFSNPSEAINLGGGSYAAQSVGNYRDIYKTIRQDRQLQRVHELFPMVSIWDDHEFSNDNWQDNATDFDGKVNEKQTARKRNGEQVWMEFLPTERGLATNGNGLEIDASDLYPNTVIYDSFNFGSTLDLITTDIRTQRADHLIPEEAFPASVPMDESAVIATLAAPYGMSVPTFTAAVWPGIRGSFAPYVNIDDSAYAAVKAGLQAIVNAGVSAELATLPPGQTPATSGSAYAAASVTGNLDASFINSTFAAAGQPQPFDASALSAMPRGLSFFLLGKTGFFSDFGSRYQVVNQTFQLYAGYTYQAFLASGGALGRDQSLLGSAQQTFLGTALATSAAAGRTWRVVASSTPYTPIRLELGDLPTGVTLPTQGTISGVTIPASIPPQFLVEFLLNADEPAGFPQYRQGIIDLLAKHDAIIVSGDIHAQLIGNNGATNGQKVIDFTVPSAASSQFRRAVSSAFASVEALMTPSVRAATGLTGNFAFDTAQKDAVINATDAIIKKNTAEMFDADTATHGYTVFTAAPDAFHANFRKIDVSNVDDNLYSLSNAALDALFQRQQFTVTKTGTGANTDLLLGVPTTVTTSVAGNTGGTVSGGGNLVTGTSATFTATPAAGYTFRSWKINGAAAGSANPLTATVTAGMVVEATFSYSLQLLHLADGEAGLLAPQTAPYLAALVDHFDGSQPNTLILAGGDNFIPGPFLNGGTDLSVRSALNSASGSTISTSASTNHPIAAVDIAIHNIIGVEASAIGNHEFDLGSKIFRDAFTPASVAGWVGATFPHISSNLDFSADSDMNARFTNVTLNGTTTPVPEASAGNGRVVPMAVITKGGQKIGLLGATTQLLRGISSPTGTFVKGYPVGITGVNDMDQLAGVLQPYIDELVAEGVNKIVLMAHLQQIANEQLLATKLSGVDIILSAGSNTRLGDADDVAATFPGHDANFANTYPISTTGADGKPVLIVNTDNEYTYMGRLVVDFDANGEVITSDLASRVAMNGAYAATAARVASVWGVSESNLATTAFAAGTKGAKVKSLTDAVLSVINSKDGTVRGYSNVYLEGERAIVRNQETNLGNLTADANAEALRAIAPTGAPIVSFKNGGGIRAQIGAIDVASGNKIPPVANPGASKPAGAVSVLDIENSLRFNNRLIVFDTTPAGLKAILEHAVASLGNQGRFPQIGGLRFSYNSSATAGSRIQNVVTTDNRGNITGRIITAGAVNPRAPTSIRMVTLNFLASNATSADGQGTGGDGYPMRANGTNFRFILDNGTLSDSVSPTLNFTDVAVVPANALGEQAALGSYLSVNHATTATAFNQVDTPEASDLRIQNTSARTDTVQQGLATFVAWMLDNGHTGNIAADSDGDGMADVVEYYFNANPNNGADRKNLPVLARNGTDLELRFTRLQNTTLNGKLRCSTDLKNWVNAVLGVDYEVIQQTVSGGEVSVRYRLLNSGVAKFYNLAVEDL